MAGVKHSTSSDGTFTAAGAAAWDAEHTLSGVADQTSVDALNSAVAALSAQHTSLAGSLAGALSAIGVNSAQMTSADNAISAAVAGLSAQHTSLAGSVAGALSAIAANSAQMTSADNAISGAVVALSAQHTSLAASVAGLLSAVAANSAQMTSADNAISAAVASVNSRATSVMSAVSVESASRAAADTSLDGRATSINTRITNLVLDDISNVSAGTPGDGQALVFNSAQNQWVASTVTGGAASVTSAEYTSLVTRHDSLANSVAGLLSAVAANSAQMTSADNAISAANASLAAVVSGWATSGVAAALPTKRILGDAQVLSATAPVSVSGMTFTCSAGVAYRFEFGIFTSCGASLAGNKFVLSLPSSAPVVVRYAQGGAVGGVSQLNVDRTNVTMANVSVSAVGVPIACYIAGTFRCSTAGGTMALAMGNNVTATGASVITVMAGSYGYIWRMA